MRKLRKILKFAGIALVVAAALGFIFLPEMGATILLHPPKKSVHATPPAGCEPVTFEVNGVRLAGWMGRCPGKARGTVIYLHGIADNRVGGAGICERFLKSGFDVIAYDSRAHGSSGGNACTYGYHEKRDLLEIVEKVEHPPVVLLGGSMGAAIALQAAGESSRGIAAVIAAESFSDLETISRERVPSFLNAIGHQKAMETAEHEGHFKCSEVSPLKAAGKIRIPVLIIHGEKDRATPPEHSIRVYQNLQGPRRLILVPDAGHGQSLRGSVWDEIEDWINHTIPR